MKWLGIRRHFQFETADPAGNVDRSQELRHGDLRNAEFPRLGLAPFANLLLMVTTATAEPEPQIAPNDGRNPEDTERRLVTDIAAPLRTIAGSDELRVLVARPSHA